jgi:hypothetical protein
MSDEMPLEDVTRRLAKLQKAAKDVSPLDQLSKMGVTRRDDGTLVVPPDVMQRVREHRLRRATISKVPSTPRYMYREGGGLGVSKSHGRWETLPLDALRRIRQKSPLLQMIHSARHLQVSRYCQRWDGGRTSIGWEVVHKDHNEVGATPPEEIKSYVRRFTNMLENPSDRYQVHTMSALLVPLWEDFATINRPVVEILRSVYDPQRIVGFRPVDGNLVWPTLVWLEKWLADNPDFFGDRSQRKDLTEDEALFLISEVVGHDITGADYCVVRDGVLEGVFDRKDLIVAPRINTTDIDNAGYPPSYVEQSIELVLSHLNTHDYNSAFFTRGMTAEFALALIGEYTDEDVSAFVDMITDATMGVERAFQPPIIPLTEDGDLKKIDFKAPNRDMMYEVWQSLLISGACAIYRMDPSEINAKPWEGSSGPSLNAPNRGSEIAAAKEEGLKADLTHLAENVLTPLARTCHPDLRVIWHHGDYKPQEEASIGEIRGRTHVTRNELRLQDGLRPKGYWVPDDMYKELTDEQRAKYDADPWNQPTDPGFSQAQSMMGGGGGMDPGMGGGFPPGQEPEPPGPDGYGGQDDGTDDGYGGPPEDYPYGKPPQGLEKGRRVRVFIHSPPR